MAVNLMFHRCSNVRLASTYVSNANSVALIVEHEGGETELTFFNLPVEVTDKFESFRDNDTSDFHDTENKTKYVDIAEVYDFANRGK